MNDLLQLKKASDTSDFYPTPPKAIDIIIKDMSDYFEKHEIFDIYCV